MIKLFFASCLFVFTTAIVVSCSNDTDQNILEEAAVIEIMERGDWQVTVFNDKGSDQLSQFKDYTFSFSKGVITAEKDGSIIKGNYVSKLDSGKNKLVFDFERKSSFDEISEDWLVSVAKADKIELNRSGKDKDQRQLTFQKK